MAVNVRTSLETPFFSAIVGGLFVTILLAASTNLICSPTTVVPTEVTSDCWNTKTTTNTGTNQATANGGVNDTSLPQIQEAKTAEHCSNYGHSHQDARGGVSICDTHITDWAIAFFTYCLVVVGWATMKSAEINSQYAERAFIFMGGGTQYPAQALGTMVHNIMACNNSGKSFGIVTSWYAGWSAKEPSGEPSYPTDGSVLHFAGNLDTIIDPGQAILLSASAVDISQTPYVFGYVRYKDIYGVERETRNCSLLTNATPQGQIHPAGGEKWNSWT